MVMDSTLLHQSQTSPFEFGVADKYLGQGRPFSNSTFSSNDLSFRARRAQSNLTSGSSGAPLPTNTSLDFNGNSLLSETPYHQSPQLLLSPPDSTTGSTNTSGNPVTSLSTFTTLPKPFPSNAYASDHFASVPSSVLSSNWIGPSMTIMERNPRVSPLSPPQVTHAYNSANGLGPPFRAPVDRLSQYPTTLPPQISPSSFPSTLRYPHNSYPPRTNGQFPYPISEPHYPGQNMPQDNQSCAGREGPPFHETQVHQHVLNLRGQHLAPEITANIQKGFFQVESKWTCYRRNYFAVHCSFNFRSGMSDGPFYLNKNGSEELIQQFAVSISAKTAVPTNGESETRGLVQHTPKRDKATETVPGRHSIAPSSGHAPGTNGTYPNHAHMYPGSNHLHPAALGGFAPFETPGTNSPPTSHTFERIQFQKATANNGKRRAQQQYFLVVVELSANIGRPGHEDWVIIATKDSDPMVVRGRSPGHYKDNGRRDSRASMDPDCGTGHGGGGHSGTVSSGSFGHGHTSVEWSNYRQQSGHFGGYSYRHAVDTRLSPVSMASSSNLADATTDADLSLSDSQTAKSSGTLSSNRSTYTPLSDENEDAMFGSLDRDSLIRKRPFEDDDDMIHLRFPLPSPFTDSFSSLASLSTIPSSKLLCASS